MRLVCVALFALLISTGSTNGQTVPRTPIPVKVEFNDGRWKMTRDGKPYYIKGAGGMGSLKLLREKGGNSNRLWGVSETTKQRLDEAHAQGISVAVGIWLEHATRGYDYQDYNQVNEQIEKVLNAVKKFKDHPAVLIWGVGNEMEGYGSGDNPAIWYHVEHLCRLIKRIDPNHPTMTVVAEIGGNRVQAIHRYCPSVDIIGINAYGGAASIPQRYKSAGGQKPYIVTEFGPHGPWESGRDEINAVVEPFSNVKAEKYRESYLSFAADKTHCLGSYSFLWGQKMEATATWFGMLLEDGRETNVVNQMSSLWAEVKPKNRAPVFHSLKNKGRNVVNAGEILRFEASFSDPDGDDVALEWVVRPEADAYITYGDFKPTPKPMDGVIRQSQGNVVQLNAPEESGLYRLYAIATDSKQLSATANIAFKVEYKPLAQPGKKIQLPFVVHGDSQVGQMIVVVQRGCDADLDLEFADHPKSGIDCIRWQTKNDASASFAFNDETGIDVMGAQRLVFWAKGTTGQEEVVVGIGKPKSSENADTFAKEKRIRLSKYWKKFHIDFANVDMRRITTCFRLSTTADAQPMTIYLDDIRFE